MNVLSVAAEARDARTRYWNVFQSQRRRNVFQAKEDFKAKRSLRGHRQLTAAENKNTTGVCSPLPSPLPCKLSQNLEQSIW